MAHPVVQRTHALHHVPGNVFSNTNLSPKRKGNVGGNGFVLTWNPKKHTDRKTGSLRENQTPGQLTAWTSNSSCRRRDFDILINR